MYDISIGTFLTPPLIGVIGVIWFIVALLILYKFPKYKKELLRNSIYGVIGAVCLVYFGADLEDTLIGHLNFRLEVNKLDSIITTLSCSEIPESELPPELLKNDCHILLPVSAVEASKALLNKYNIPYPEYGDGKEGYSKWKDFMHGIRDYAEEANLKEAREFGISMATSEKFKQMKKLKTAIVP